MKDDLANKPRLCDIKYAPSLPTAAGGIQLCKHSQRPVPIKRLCADAFQASCSWQMSTAIQTDLQT